MAEEVLAWNLRATGQQQVSQAFRQTRGELGALSGVTQETTSKFSGLAAGSSALGSQLSRVSPQMGAFASSIGTAGGAISGLTTAIGGVGGLIAGGAVAALGILTTHLANTKKEADEAEKSVVKLANAFDRITELAEGFEKFTSALTGANLEKLTFGELQERSRALESSLALPGNTAEQTRELERQLALVREISAATAFLRPGETLAGTRDQKGREERERKEKRPGVFSQRTAGGVLELTTQQAAAERAIEENKRRQELLTRIAETESERRIEAAKNAAEAEVEVQQEAFRQLREGRNQEIESYEEAAERFARTSERLRNEQQQSTAMGIQSAQALAGGAISVFQALAKGQELTGAQIVAMIGDQLVALGTSWIFQGIAETILGRPQGTALVALGGAATTAGIAMGAAGSDSTPNAGGGYRQSYEDRVGRPTMFGRGAERPPEGGTTIVYNISTLVADENAGMRIEKARAAARRVHGKAAMVGG